MNDIQTDTSDEALIVAIRANMCDMFRVFSRSMPEEHYEDGKFTRWLTSLGHPWFNGVLASHSPADADEAFIRETVNYFRARQIGVFTWWMEPHVAPAAWEPILKKSGFGFSNDTPGMAVDLQQLNEAAARVDNLEIQVVADEGALRTWIHIFLKGFGLPPQWEDAFFGSWLNIGLDFPMRNYLGYWNGKPVSTSTIFFGGGVTGIYCVATLPEARGKGIGAAITVRPLLDARTMGYRIGTLQSSEMGFGVYKKLGFRHLCQIENFYYAGG